MFEKKATAKDLQKANEDVFDLVLAICSAVGGLCEAIARQSGADPAKVVADFRESLESPDQPKTRAEIAHAVEGAFLLAAKQAELRSLQHGLAKAR